MMKWKPHPHRTGQRWLSLSRPSSCSAVVMYGNPGGSADKDPRGWFITLNTVLTHAARCSTHGGFWGPGGVLHAGNICVESDLNHEMTN